MRARDIREFIHALFQSGYSRLLEQQIIELKQDRDYFKGRAERLELILTSRFSPVVTNTYTSNAQAVPQRPSMAQLQRELDEREAQSEKTKEN
jgi:hypothetical protein